MNQFIRHTLSFWLAYSSTLFCVAEDSQTGATTITRDEWGVAHIHGKTHADAIFGVGYAQAEDYF